jgi:hypothetical protein
MNNVRFEVLAVVTMKSMKFSRSPLAFWRNVLPPSSWLESKLSKKPMLLGGFLLDVLFSSEDGGNAFPQNVVGLLLNCRALQPRSYDLS